MNKAILQELKEMYCDIQPWDSLSNKYRAGIIALIDNELARQVPDGEIQAAIEELQSAVRISAWHNSDYVDTPIKDKTLRTALAALRQHCKQEPWIPVSERLPQSYDHENGEPMEFLVMIKEAKRPTTLCFDGYEWFDMNWCIPKCEQTYPVTHWMPLPEPPLGGAAHDWRAEAGRPTNKEE